MKTNRNDINITDFDTVLFDLDGTLYMGKERVPGANRLVDLFRNLNKKIFFTTNNSTKTRMQIYERLVKFGIRANLEEVLTSGYIAADYAIRTNMKDIYIFGSTNLIHEFESLNIVVNQNIDAENLLIGYDPNMTYEDLVRAVQVAINAKCIIACNKERVYPGDNGLLFPGCGAMTASVEWCSKKQCDLVIGKPNTMMIEFIEHHYSIDRKKVLVIGDTLESDVEMAKRAGCQSILISSKKVDEVPVFNSILEIYRYFKDAVQT